MLALPLHPTVQIYKVNSHICDAVVLDGLDLEKENSHICDAVVLDGIDIEKENLHRKRLLNGSHLQLGANLLLPHQTCL